nr:DUF3006 domain-containing protein [Alkalicoccus halolimnae]
MAMSKYQGFIDRIEDNKFAVIIIESLKEEYIVEASDLPDGVQSGSHLHVNISNGRITSMIYDKTKTNAVENRISDKMAELREKKKKSRYEK